MENDFVDGRSFPFDVTVNSGAPLCVGPADEVPS